MSRGSSAFVLFILTIAVASVSVQLQRTVHAEEYSYSGFSGPGNWGSLSSSYSPCLTRKDQSPIDIVKNQAVRNIKLGPLAQNYRPVNGTLINHGQSISVSSAEDIGTLVIDGKTYNLKQFHWHTPSEHRINGIQYPAEIHLLHKASDGSIAVVAVLYNYGNPDPLLTQIGSQLKELANEVCGADEDSHIPLGTFNSQYLRRRSRKYYRYLGSTTTPPCTGSVTWTVLNKVREISKEQVEALKAPLKGDCKNNNRPVQPLNGRQVQFYHK